AAVAPHGPLVVEFASSAERGEREAAGDALGHADDGWLDAVVLDGKHLAGAAEATLHLVGDEHNPVLTAALDPTGHERSGRWDVSPFAEPRLEDDGSGLLWRRHRLQQVVEALQRVRHRGVLVRR